MSDDDKKEVQPVDPELTRYPELAQKGFEEDEIRTLTRWIDQGKPGLAKSKAERMGDIYLLGYSCQEINKWFPEYPLEVLLFARAQYNWDELRAKYRQQVQQNTLAAATATRLESIRFLSELISATHLKWRKDILAYIANPDGNKPPECLPSGIYQYGQAMGLLKDLVTPDGGGGSKGGDANPSGPTPLVSVTVKSGDKDKPDVVIESSSQEDIRKALLAESGIDDDK